MSCEIYVVGDGGHNGGNGYVTVNDDIYSEYSGTSDTTIKKQLHKEGVNTKMFHSRAP